MKYNPSRDIPKAVRILKTTSPTSISEWVKNNRTTKDHLNRRIQVNITPQAVTMWFKRHPNIHKKLIAEVETEELNGVVIRETLFQNGAFRQLDCIKKWEIQYFARGGKERTLQSWLGCLKMICQGILPKKQGLIEGWGLKHPRQLTLDDGMKYITECEKREIRHRRFNLAIRNFFKTMNVEGWEQISGKQDTDAGKYAHLFVTKQKIKQILAYLKELDIRAYRACLFSYKTGSRMGGTMSAHSSKINKEDHTIFVTEKASRGKPKREIEKFISQDLWEELDLDHAKGKLFDIEPEELRKLCKTAFQAVIPEKAKQIPMPFHFWRHMFAQHGLRATNWNLATIAELGGWTTEALERYYGKMPRTLKLQKAKEFVHTL